jgi:hypothetical protein
MVRCDDCGKRFDGYSEQWTLRRMGLACTMTVCKRCGRRLRKVKAEDQAKYHAELCRLLSQQENYSNRSRPAPRL